MRAAGISRKLNRNSCKWTILGQAAEVRRSDERSRVIDVLKKTGSPLSAKDIMVRADLTNRNATDLLLGKMAGDGEIERVGRGQYALPSNLSEPRTNQTDRGAKSVRPKSSDRSTDRLASGKRIDNSNELANLSDLCALSDTGQIHSLDLSDNLSAPQTDPTDSPVVQMDSAPLLGPPGDSLDDFH
jgi:hypothetical protein